MAKNGQIGLWSRVFGGRSSSRALTAAGSPLVEPFLTPGGPIRSNPETVGALSSPARPDSIRARHAEWQIEALTLGETVPELAGAFALVRASMQGVLWTVKGGNAATRARIQRRINDLDKERLAELVWGSGETYLAAPVDRGQNIEQLEPPFSLSVVEFKPAQVSGGRDQMMGPNGEWVDIVEENTDAPVPFGRIWRHSKLNRWQAYSPVKAALEVLRAMYTAQLVDTATQESRLINAGIVFWPTNAPDIPLKPGEDPTPGSRQAMLKAFKDATSQGDIARSKGKLATQPFVVMYDPGKGGDATKYQPEMFRIERQDLASQRQIRTDVDSHRIATALELPVESVSGLGDANRWSAWQIDVDKWKTWFKPLDDDIRKQVEKMLVKPYGADYYLETDATQLIAKPDETDVVIKLAQLEQVTPESAVQALKDKDISGLVAQKPPQGVRPSRAPDQPSDFGGGDTNRGGGKFRQGP